MKRLGVIVNPIAGMGGRCALKGTDGAEILARACALGARPEAPGRAITALAQLAAAADGLEILTVSGAMGADELRAAGLASTVLFATGGAATSGADTRRAAREMVAAGVDLLVFVGGDGTARDVCAEASEETVCLGVPAGCKIHSGVYGINPRSAGELAALYLAGRVSKTRQAEVMDIDEEAFRAGRVSAALYGYLTVPADAAHVQDGKAGRTQSEEHVLDAISYHLRERLEPGALTILGTGSTLLGIKQRLGLEGTLLGVDVLRGGALAAADAGERELLALLEAHGEGAATIVVTVIGGQGYIFGRGNQQLSPRVIERVGREHIIVVATKAKLAGLAGKPLLVDTGSEATNEMLRGYLRVIVGYDEQMVVRVSA